MQYTPQRIISLVPSQTELLYDLGLNEEVVGITKFCIHPSEWFRTKTRVGGTKNVHPEIVESLKPDLILANKEENVKEQVEGLQHLAPVYVSDIANLEDALEMIGQIATLTGSQAKADPLIKVIREAFASLEFQSATIPCAYLIWRNPWMVAGGDTFINDMLKHAGFLNVFNEQNRYPAIDADALAASGCRVVLLSSEPYPFRDKHISEIREVLPEAKILLVDGEMFSWYGSRLQYAPGYFRGLRRGLDVS